MNESISDFLAAKLAYEIDVQDVDQGMRAGDFTVVDTRKLSSWEHGRILGAVHIPASALDVALPGGLPIDTPLVVYGWGPGCNGATRTAAVLVAKGYQVREMIGGFEYWVRSGLTVETDSGLSTTAADPLVRAER